MSGPTISSVVPFLVTKAARTEGIDPTPRQLGQSSPSLQRRLAEGTRSNDVLHAA